MTKIFISFETIDRMIGGGQINHDALMLMTLLWAYDEGPPPTFSMTDEMAERLGWSRRRLTNACRRLLDRGYITRTKPARASAPAEYLWAEDINEHMWTEE